jgi:hypothetical protein
MCHEVRWLTGGKIVLCESDGHADWASSYRFDGSQLIRDRRIQFVADFPLAFGPHFEWMLELSPNVSYVGCKAVTTRVSDEQELRRVGVDLGPYSSSSYYIVSSDARWLSDGESLFDLTTGKKRPFPYRRIFGFTPDNLVITARTPYQSSVTEEEASFVETYLSITPILRYLNQLREQEQIVLVDPATGDLIFKFACAKGTFSGTIVSPGGRALGAILETEPRQYFIACGYGGVGGVSTTRNLLIWNLPARSR